MTNEKEITKKCWPEMFEKVKSGEKKFEIRLADVEMKKGDILTLKEFNPKTKKFTGREIRKRVEFSLKTKELPYWTAEEIDKYGYVITSLGEMK